MMLILESIWEVQLFGGDLKRELLRTSENEFLKKINGWKQGTLSLAGKEVLIKAIVSAVPTYYLMCFWFPKSICNDISSDLIKFWWGKLDSEAKIHCKSWNS